MCVCASACVSALGNAQHAARNAFIEKNNMQLLLLLAVKEKYYTNICLLHCFSPLPHPCLVTDYMHIMHSHNGQSLQHVVNNK